MWRFAASIVCGRRTHIDACGECPPCRKLASGNHPDVAILTPNDKNVITIDAVRELTQRLALKATEAERKVVIIEQAERMNAAAQNALLKTLEEPPGPTCFMIATTRIRSVAITIRSRCQRLRLSTRADETTAMALHEALPDVDATLARMVAALASGDLEVAKAYIEGGAGQIYERLVGAVGTDRLRDVLSAAADLGGERENADLALAFLEIVVRDGLARAHGASGAQLFAQGKQLPREQLAAAARALTELRANQNLHVNRTLALESVLVALTPAA